MAELLTRAAEGTAVGEMSRAVAYSTQWRLLFAGAHAGWLLSCALIIRANVGAALPTSLAYKMRFDIR